MAKGIPILPIVLLIFVAVVGTFAWTNMFSNLFTNTQPVNSTMNGSFQLAQTGAITFGTLISPIPILLGVVLVAAVGLLALAITRRHTRF